MKTSIVLAVVALLASAPMAAAATVGELDVRVLTPPGYERDSRSWPVVYVLPGSGADAGDGVVALDLTAYAARKEAIVVSVAEPGGSGENLLTDYADGTHRYETSFFADVVPWVQRNYRTTNRRAIVGYSSGGYSATALASRHPGTFSAVGSISGLVDLEDLGPAGGYVVLAPIIAFSGPEAAFGIWGDPIQDQANFHAHNPTALAPALRGTPAVFVSSGTGRPASVEEVQAAQLGTVPNAVSETTIARWTANYHRALAGAGVRHVYRTHEGMHRKDPHFRADFAAFWPQAIAALRRSRGRRRAP